MSPCRLALSAVLAGTLFLPALAQNPVIPPPVRGPNTRPGQTTPPTRRERQEPCWKVAGISKAAMEQRHVLAEQAKQEVEAVCANSSLTITQKRHEIRAIHERERQQVEAIITPQQREAMKACQESRGHGGGGGGGGGGMGPCGEMPAGVPPRGTTPPSKPPTRDDED